MTKTKSLTLIEDPSLEPYFITKDDYNYIVNIKVQTNKDHFRSNGVAKQYEKSIKFYPNFKSALQYIAEEKLHNKRHYNSIQDFIDDYRKIESNITNNISYE
jgi:hypothetical protein